MADSTRKVLSRKLKQKWKDPEYRKAVTEAMQVGSSPCFAGTFGSLGFAMARQGMAVRRCSAG